MSLRQPVPAVGRDQQSSLTGPQILLSCIGLDLRPTWFCRHSLPPRAGQSPSIFLDSSPKLNRWGAASCAASPNRGGSAQHNAAVYQEDRENSKQSLASSCRALGHFQSKPGHVPRCINRSVLHLRRPTNILLYTLYPCTYYGMTIIRNGLDYFEI